MCWQEGEPLYWPVREVDAVTASGSELRGISSAAAAEVYAQALAAWTSVDCGGVPPSISVSATRIDEALSPLPHDPGVEDPTEDGLDGENALYFIDQGWPHGIADIALTTTSFRVSSGRIIESDIEVNSERNQLTVGDSAPVVDLLSVLTHEAGHFFGLTHVFAPGPTMFVSYTGDGDLGPRSLDADDIAGMCAIYPRDRFENVEEGGCGCRVAGAARGRGSVWALLVLGAASLRRRRRSGSRSTPAR